MTPILEAVSDEITSIPFVKVDIDENDVLAREYNIMTIPTLLFIQNGEIVDKSVGLLSKEQLMVFVQKHI